MNKNIIVVKDIVEEDCINYKKINMFIICPKCSFKCDKENKTQVCQNLSLNSLPDIRIDVKKLLLKYENNPLSEAVVLGGLEPFDTFDSVKKIVETFRNKTEDEIVIYTGYNPLEIKEELVWLSKYKNIIVKFGRFIPKNPPHYDEVLGVYLSSLNQYADYITPNFIKEVLYENY